MARLGPIYDINDSIRAEFLKGIILQAVHGEDQGWGHDEWYYLVDPKGGPRPHWVLESEIIGRAYKKLY